MRFVGGEKVCGGPTGSQMRALFFLVTLLTTTLVCAPAQAGTYDVYSCRLPNGSPAPTNGWTPFATPADLGPVGTATDDCDHGGSLIASLPSVVLAGMDAGWT